MQSLLLQVLIYMPKLTGEKPFNAIYMITAVLFQVRFKKVYA